MNCQLLKWLLPGCTLLLIAGCVHEKPWATGTDHNPSGPRTIGKLESKGPRFDQLVAPDAAIEKLAQGFA